jgi:hypothetical protein
MQPVVEFDGRQDRQDGDDPGQNVDKDDYRHTDGGDE